MRDAQLLELISAYVDDELTVEQRAFVERELASSADSRDYLSQLRQQRTFLRQLSGSTPAPDLSNKILAAIAGKQPVSEQSFAELLSASLDGALDPSEDAAVREHLSRSTEGRQYVEQLRQQRSMLRNLKSVRAPAELAVRVQTAVEAARPLVRGASREVAAVAVRSRSWMKRVTYVGSAVAAGFALFLILRMATTHGTVQNGVDIAQPGTAIPGPGGLLPVPRTDSHGPQGMDTELALQEFQKIVKHVFVYDIYVTPKGREAKCVERWLKASGIPIADTVKVDEKTERSIFNAPFGRDAVKLQLPGKVDPEQVEMMLVRGTNGHIDDVRKAYLEDGSLERGEAQILVDMLFAPRDLEVLMKLNEAAGMDLAQMKADPGALSTAQAFRVRFAGVGRGGLGSFGMTSMLMGDFAAAPADEPAPAERVAPQAELPNPPPAAADVKDDPFRSEPAQCIFIIRLVK